MGAGRGGRAVTQTPRRLLGGLAVSKAEILVGHLFYVPEELHQYRVREVGPARQMSVARAAVGVGRVRQAREGALEVEEKDAVPLRVEPG